MHIAIVAALAMVAGTASAAAPSCLGQIGDAAAAAAQADWIIEANVRDVMMLMPERRPQFIVEDVKVVTEKVASAPYKTAMMPLDACPHASVRDLAAQGAAIEGRRMRFYGSRFSRAPLRRIFYAEPVSVAAPAVPLPAAWSTRAQPGERPIGGGWHRAHSTDGRFSIDLPGPYVEVTKAGPQEAGAMLRAQDPLGSVFIAVFEPLGAGAALYRTYDDALLDPANRKLTYKGRPAVAMRSVQSSGQVYHAMYVRVPGGTFMLGMAAAERNEAASLARRDRFIDSLALD